MKAKWLIHCRVWQSLFFSARSRFFLPYFSSFSLLLFLFASQRVFMHAFCFNLPSSEWERLK